MVLYCKSSSRTLGATLYHTSHTCFFLHSFWLPIAFFIVLQTSSMGFMSGEYPGHSRTGIPLYSMNVLVILELLQEARSCIKIYPFCGTTTHSHESIFHVITIDTIVVLAANRMRNIMLCIQTTLKLPVSVQVWGAISNRGLSFLRKLNGNMDSAKYQGDVFMILKWEVNALCSHRRNISLCMVSRHATRLKVLEHS